LKLDKKNIPVVSIEKESEKVFINQAEMKKLDRKKRRELAITYATQIASQYNPGKLNDLTPILEFAIKYADSRITLNQDKEKHEYLKQLWSEILQNL